MEVVILQPFSPILEKLHQNDLHLLFWLLRCKLIPVMAEVDRIIRPGGTLIVRDEPNTIKEVEALLKSLHWEITYTKEQEGMLCAKRGTWRPDSAALS